MGCCNNTSSGTDPFENAKIANNMTSKELRITVDEMVEAAMSQCKDHNGKITK